MTPEQVALVERSLAAARPRLRELAADFYARLFDAHSDLRALFSSDPVAQQEKLAAELDAIVSAIPSHADFLVRARDLGVRHARLGTTAPHYRMVGDALLEALASASGPGWTDELAQAWAAAYALVAEVMMAGAADAAEDAQPAGGPDGAAPPAPRNA